MTTDPTHERFIQHHGPVHSEPLSGAHETTTYESVDASVRMVLVSLGIIAVTLIVTAFITIPIQRILKVTTPLGHLPSPLAPARVIPKGPLLQEHPWEELPELRAHEDQVLSTTGTTDGHKHVAINQAIDTMVSQIPVRPDSGPGLALPGGQGRQFSGSLEAMPPAYKYQGLPMAGETTSKEPTVIRGEIRKNAQK